MQVQPYLFFAGNCEEALGFYETALGATRPAAMRYRESPDPHPPGMIPDDWGDKIMHACLQIGETQIMASDGCGAPGAERADFRSFFRLTFRRPLCPSIWPRSCAGAAKPPIRFDVPPRRQKRSSHAIAWHRDLAHEMRQSDHACGKLLGGLLELRIVVSGSECGGRLPHSIVDEHRASPDALMHLGRDVPRLLLEEFRLRQPSFPKRFDFLGLKGKHVQQYDRAARLAQLRLDLARGSSSLNCISHLLLRVKAGAGLVGRRRRSRSAGLDGSGKGFGDVARARRAGSMPTSCASMKPRLKPVSTSHSTTEPIVEGSATMPASL